MTRPPSGRGSGGNWRNRPASRPNNSPTRRDDDGEPDGRGPSAPVMSRSRVQLSTTYAPGVLFTWEGAKGICRSVPIEREPLRVHEATRLLIFDGIREIASNWFARASTIRGGDVPIDLILDDIFYNPTTFAIEPDWQTNFQLSDPGLVGYVPYPLLYRCAVCGSVKEYQSIEEQGRRPLPARCRDHQARWNQVDVVFAHWSGGIEPLTPFNNNYDAARNTVTQIRFCKCGSEDFRLQNESAVFSDWQFICEQCGATRELIHADRLSLEKLEHIRQRGGRGFERIEVNMLPVSYRANSAFYPQRSAFIEFANRDVVDLLMPQRRGDLARRVAELHGIPFNEPSDDVIEAALRTAGRETEWLDYSQMREWAGRAATPHRAEQLRRDAATAKEQWFAQGLIERGSVQSPALLSAVTLRSERWARRYDPIRLTIEHDRFVAEHIEERRRNHEAVDVTEPDVLICEAVGNPTELARYQTTVRDFLQRLGVDQMVLIRGLPLCDFSFGFTRVSSSPIYQREINGRSVDMPVRLNAFPMMPNNRHPVYVTQQKNEALYFRVDPRRVRRWLDLNGIDDLPDLTRSLGAAYVEQYTDFGPFLEAFKEREGRGTAQRSLTAYTYMLLHSLAHQVMHALADVSGLDRDGLGEYIFPADLAFVVYRKGMTPDLGNISAMWRNHAFDFLRRMFDPRLLRCGSGTLCDSRGGACPACIMVAEVSCIGSNVLLSRSALRGGPAPLWEPQGNTPLVGFFDPAVAQ